MARATISLSGPLSLFRVKKSNFTRFRWADLETASGNVRLQLLMNNCSYLNGSLAARRKKRQRQTGKLFRKALAFWKKNLSRNVPESTGMFFA